jgi:hypothetical protein
MAFAGFAHSTTTEQVTRSYDRWIIAGYAIVAAAAIVALYFASGGPGNGDAALAAMVAMP